MRQNRIGTRYPAGCAYGNRLLGGRLAADSAGRRFRFVRSYEPQVDGGSAFAYPDAPLAAYFTFSGTVKDTPGLYLTVMQPNGGEEWTVGSSHEIKWDPGTVTGTVFIDYSKNNFVSDIQSIGTDEPNDGSFMWQNIPDDPSTTVLVRISSTDDPSVFDKSDGVFTIKSAQWPTEPVLIDPNHTIIGTRFAIDGNGTIHALYTDGQSVWWSYSDDYGNTWTNVSTPAYTVPANRELQPHNIAMDADAEYVYATLCERDQNGTGTTSYLKGLRLDISDSSAGWSSITIWTLPGYFIYQNIEGSQLSVADDGGVMVFAIRYQPATFEASFSYATSWSALENSMPLDLNGNAENGYETYVYVRHTIQMVHDSVGNFYLTLGGNFNDYDSTNGYGTDYGNTLLRYNKSTGRWRFIQTSDHPETEHYWLSETRGLAIDENDVIHWVFEYAYNWPTESCAAGCWTCYGDWKLVYATGAASGEHANMTFYDPINETDFHRTVGSVDQYDCAYDDNAWIHTSIGVEPDGGSVVIVYQDSWNNCEVKAVRNDGSGWSVPENVEGPDLYGYAPWGRMHPSGWFLLTFTDYDWSTNGGSKKPYFVAWM